MLPQQHLRVGIVINAWIGTGHRHGVAPIVESRSGAADCSRGCLRPRRGRSGEPLMDGMVAKIAAEIASAGRGIIADSHSIGHGDDS
jgi:hypothetical protein